MTDDRKPMANIPPFGLRMQPDLKAALEEAARANSRSMNAELIARLQASLTDEEKLWDEVNRIAETVDAMARTLDRIAPKVESLWESSEP